MSTDDNVIRPEFGKLRNVEPSMTFLMSTDCLVQSILTASNTLLDAHELEALKRGARFRHYGDISADIMIGSKTTRGHQLTCIGHDSGKIEHHWAYDN